MFKFLDVREMGNIWTTVFKFLDRDKSVDT